MMSNPRMTWLKVLACMMPATVFGAASGPLCITAAASTVPQVIVSPTVVHPTDQYYATTGAFEGTGAMVTVTVGPNDVLRPGWPVEVQECDADPNASSDCDMGTTLPFDEVTKERAPAAANGSVTFHFLVWSPLPDKWDPYSGIRVGPGYPTSLWIGDDPSEWATTGIVTAPLTIATKAAEATATAPSHLASPLHRGVQRGSHGSNLGTALTLGLISLAVVVFAATLGWQRRRRAAI
jgi:hypothetical protein